MSTFFDMDWDGSICAITIEYVRERAEIPQFSYKQIQV